MIEGHNAFGMNDDTIYIRSISLFIYKYVCSLPYTPCSCILNYNSLALVVNYPLLFNMVIETHLIMEGIKSFFLKDKISAVQNDIKQA